MIYRPLVEFRRVSWVMGYAASRTLWDNWTRFASSAKFVSSWLSTL